MDDKQFRQFFQRELGRLFTRDVESADEVVDTFNELFAVIQKLKSYTDEQLQELGSGIVKELIDIVKNTEQKLETLTKRDTDIQKEIGAVDLKIDAELSVLKKKLTDEISDLSKQIEAVQIIKGEDGRDGRDGKDGSPDTPEQVRDKLETLKDDERLDKSAIKGLDDLDKRFTQIASMPKGNGGGSPVRLQHDGTLVSDRPVSTINFGNDLNVTQSGDTATVEFDGLEGVGVATITVSSSQPANPAIGDLWVDIS